MCLTEPTNRQWRGFEERKGDSGLHLNWRLVWFGTLLSPSTISSLKCNSVIVPISKVDFEATALLDENGQKVAAASSSSLLTIALLFDDFFFTKTTCARKLRPSRSVAAIIQPLHDDDAVGIYLACWRARPRQLPATYARSTYDWEDRQWEGG